MSIKTILQSVLLAVLVLGLPGYENARAGKHRKLLDQTGCARCPVCDHTCKLEVEEAEIEGTCFNIETKVICIPRVVFPWQKAKKAACASCDACDGRGCSICVHNGARLRKVRVAKPDSYQCPTCKYTWTAEKKDTCCAAPCCTTGCATGYCDAIPAVNVELPPGIPAAMPQIQAPVPANELPSPN